MFQTCWHNPWPVALTQLTDAQTDSQACTALFVCRALYSLHRHTAFCKYKATEGMKTWVNVAHLGLLFSKLLRFSPLNWMLFVQISQVRLCKGSIKPNHTMLDLTKSWYMERLCTVNVQKCDDVNSWICFEVIFFSVQSKIFCCYHSVFMWCLFIKCQIT